MVCPLVLFIPHISVVLAPVIRTTSCIPGTSYTFWSTNYSESEWDIFAAVQELMRHSRKTYSVLLLYSAFRRDVFQELFFFVVCIFVAEIRSLQRKNERRKLFGWKEWWRVGILYKAVITTPPR